MSQDVNPHRIRGLRELRSLRSLSFGLSTRTVAPHITETVLEAVASLLQLEAVNLAQCIYVGDAGAFPCGQHAPLVICLLDFLNLLLKCCEVYRITASSLRMHKTALQTLGARPPASGGN